MGICLLFAALLGVPGFRRSGSTVTPGDAKIAFGKEMDFSATVQSDQPVREATLILRDSSSHSSAYPAVISVQEGYQLAARRDLQADPVFPFSSVDYWWDILLASGEKIVTEKQSLQYADDRFTWQSFEKGPATVRWVEGDPLSAQDAADLLLMELGTESADLALPVPGGVELYIYPRLADFHSGLGKLVYGWEGAVTDPASGIILIAAAPGAEGRESLATLLPHEAVHVLLGARWKEAYASLPQWLVEGTAAGFETEPRPEADRVFREAARTGTLIPMAALCRSFPSEEGPALLAYAESKSFVAYLRATLGTAALRTGMEAYAAGADCAQGFSGSTGSSLDLLERSWREGLSGRPLWAFSTWSVVLAAGVILAGVILAGRVIRWRRRPGTLERKTLV
jgi:hypothetical protein